MDEFGIFMKVVEMEQSQKLARSIGEKNCRGFLGVNIGVYQA